MPNHETRAWACLTATSEAKNRLKQLRTAEQFSVASLHVCYPFNSLAECPNSERNGNIKQMTVIPQCLFGIIPYNEGNKNNVAIHVA